MSDLDDLIGRAQEWMELADANPGTQVFSDAWAHYGIVRDLALLASSAPATASEPVEYADLQTLTDEELAAAEAPTATASEGGATCCCQIIGWNHDPYEPHIPKVPEYEQADDCPVHPLAAGVTSSDGDRGLSDEWSEERRTEHFYRQHGHTFSGYGPSMDSHRCGHPDEECWTVTEARRVTPWEVVGDE